MAKSVRGSLRDGHTFKIEVQGRPLVGRIRHLLVLSSVANLGGAGRISRYQSPHHLPLCLLVVPFVVALSSKIMTTPSGNDLQ